ncbi:MAG TPA: VWA domain-containing protein [Nitrospiraceae bacterium]|nr:VWA domain-containing protein [Nitrospiraceae bacterium]
MADLSTQNALIDRLAGELEAATAAALVARLAGDAGRPDRVAAVLSLLDELEEVSSRAARAAIEALPELDRRAGLSQVTAWLDLGVALAGSSGATALKYFKDSPLILGVIELPPAQAAVLGIGLELADQDPNVTLEYLRTAPQILSVVPSDHLRPWLEIGVELTQVDVVVGLEYIRQIPALVPVLPLDEIRGWLSFGMKLIAPNSLGKPDYMATMEFLRTSPGILGDIEHPAVRAKVVSLGALLAGHSPESGVVWLAESPRVLRALPSMEWQMKVLRYGLLLGEKDAEATLSYLRRCPEIIGLIGDVPQAATRFENWFKAGMEVLAYSPEGARAYFAVESQRALASVEEALSGVALRQVARTVKLFVQGLCGSDVAITALPDSMAASTARATVSADGRTISLPAMLRRYATAGDNERLYLVMAAHEAGHLEFGTYRLRLELLVDLIEVVRQRYGRSQQAMPDTLAALFRLYPHPRLIQDLWVVLEDARIEYLLQAEYPGLRRELAQLAADAITPRDPAHGLTVKELIVDCLLRLSTGESADAAVPHALKAEVAILWTMAQSVLRSTATAEDTVRLAHGVYVRMEELLAPRAEMIKADQSTDESQDLGVGPTASEQTGDEYRPVTNWVYRGAMNPEFIAREPEQAEQADGQQLDLDRTASQGGGSKEHSGAGRGTRRGEQESTSGDVLGSGRSLPSAVEELLALEVEQQPVPEVTFHDERTVRYPEWDHTIQDYRMNWCRVVERPAAAGSDEFVSATLTTHQSVIKSLRRFFESLRPPAFRRVAGQADGEDLDIDAVVRRAADQRAGFEGGDRIYVRREKKERDVAVAFLVDVSGSTSRQLESGRRVIDIEKESLVLLCEALEAVGDQYGLYAYSGQGRASVDFLTIKDFDDRLGASTAHRLGGLGPRQQNRDGAAIRHATAKLLAREVKTRILMLLSDGRPLDGEYKDEYSLEDTKAALRDAKRRGVDPFCVTIDRDADSYLRRMYGEVQYSVIDRIETLPTRLPRIYQQLAT